MKLLHALFVLGLAVGTTFAAVDEDEVVDAEDDLELTRARRQVVAQPVYQVPVVAPGQPIAANPTVSQYYETLENALVNLAVVSSRTKPAAHIVGNAQASWHVSSQGPLKIWKEKVTNGGMKLDPTSHELIVPTSGPYYCYAQVYFNTGREQAAGTKPPSPRHESDARFYLFVNQKATLLSSEQPAIEVSAYTGAVMQLNAQDRISVHVYTPNVRVWRGEDHSFFGCYLI
ncbi:tumor necrosis factor-like [Sycon ciliatum]|uniref:tumor necrosis factor-like n=1 Tax=Sycon ciliatum TaxID=27933 RepID=UPI0020A8A123|eukprot:scpid81402/ scgid33567/ 